jgi:hypothetical protein
MNTFQDALLEELLRKNERILWTGRPIQATETRKLTEKFLGISLILAIIWILFVFVALKINLFILFMLVGAFLLLLTMLLILYGYSFYNNPKFTYYSITTYRIITMDGSNYMRIKMSELNIIEKVETSVNTWDTENCTGTITVYLPQLMSRSGIIGPTYVQQNARIMMESIKDYSNAEKILQSAISEYKQKMTIKMKA